MFDQNDIRKIEERGSSVSEVEAQVERFRKGFPWLDMMLQTGLWHTMRMLQ